MKKSLENNYTCFPCFPCFRSTKNKENKENRHVYALRGIARAWPAEKTTPPAGEAHGGDGTAESARVLLIPLESELLLIPTGYHSTRPPFVKGVAENANDSGG